jgi:predicted Zn-dependent peptidase
MPNHTSAAVPGSVSDRVTTLRCGMPVACERVDGARSVSVAWMLPAGAAHDPDKLCGISSVSSELIFRGAGDMDSRAAADAFDRIGALRSAESSIRRIGVAATTTGDRLEALLGLMTDLVRRPRFEAASVEPAKALALQSLASLQDDPQERAVLAARERHLPSPFNRSTYGDEAGIRAITRERALDWWHAHAVPGGSVLTIAGDVDRDAAVARIDDLLGDWSGVRDEPAPRNEPVRGYAHEAEESNQVQIVVVQDGPAAGDPDSDLERLAVSVLSGGMSGRLFTQVREVRGLCYAVHASYRADRDRGVMSSYVGTTPERAQESLDVLFEQLEQINTGDVTPDEFRRAQIGMRSKLVFSGESTGARAATIAGDLVTLGRVRTLDERLETMAAITLDQLNDYLRRRTPGKPTIQTLGPAPLTPPVG